jgi:hypothetical protein
MLMKANLIMPGHCQLKVNQDVSERGFAFDAA